MNIEFKGFIEASITESVALTNTLEIPVQTLRGIAINSVTGYPVGGCNVIVTSSLPAATRPVEVVLGQTTTAADGRWEVRIDESAAAKQAMILVRRSEDAVVSLKLMNAAGALIPSTIREEKIRFGRPVTVLAQLPVRAVASTEWTVLGQRMADMKVAQLHKLALGILDLEGGIPVAPDWVMDLKHSVLQALEVEFLDPKSVLRAISPVPSLMALRAPGGLEAYRAKVLSSSTVPPAVGQAFAELQSKATSFGSLMDVDWVIDNEQFTRGQIGGAITKNQQTYENRGGILTGGIDISKDNQLISYRNYLRNVFTGAPNSASYAQWRQQLENRFKQDFATTNTAEYPANAVIIPVVKSILTATAGANYGFGIPAANIPAQGTKTNREYLDALVALSGISADEFAKRYRLNLQLPDNAVKSPVQLNIDTLQGFYSDGFQSGADPFPIIPANKLGRGVFYLTYEEWLSLNGPFYPENFYQIRRTFDMGAWNDDIAYFEQTANSNGADARLVWFARFLEIQRTLEEAYKKADLQLYAQAKEIYLKAASLVENLLFTKLEKIGNEYVMKPHKLNGNDVLNIVTPALNNLLSFQVKTPTDLESETGYPSGSFVDHYRNTIWEHPSSPNNSWEFLDEVTDMHSKHRLMLMHVYLYLIPMSLGDLAMTTGEWAAAELFYAQTTAFSVGKANLSDGPGFASIDYYDGSITAAPVHGGSSELFPRGNRPYSSESGAGAPAAFRFASPYPVSRFKELAPLVVPNKTHSMERKFFRLRHCNAILEWADALYRTGDKSDTARARELYKAVIFAHGFDPGIAPKWNQPGPIYLNMNQNPAVSSQLARALKGLTQIDSGLNYYGATDGYVPPQRYYVLKEAADRFASAAKSASQDFLTSVSKIEEAVRDGIMTANMLKKAGLQAAIAGEQIDMAKIGVKNANAQVQAVQKAIEDKKKELEDHQAFGQQFLDFCGGFVDSITSLPKGATDGLASSAAVGYGLGGQVTGSGWMGMGAAGAGYAAAGAFGIFIYAGVSGIMAQGEGQNRRADELKQLRESALPKAQEQLVLQQKQQRIVELQQQIALADAQLAQDLMHFQATRTLTTEFWANVAAVMKRLLRRYLELGARYAWMAERALAYEQDRDINIVRYDYFPTKTYNVTGPDLLAMDLAELEASRLAAMKLTVPVKLTYSLASEFPLAFAQLKKTGRCNFWPSEARLRAGYPGVYGYRVRAVTLSLSAVNPRGGARGILTTRGVSVITRRDGSSHVSVRMPDALPFSDFDIRQDGPLYGMAGETLLNFEGSGLESWWTIEFPKAANRQGLDDITDVLVTFDLTSSYAPELYEQHVQNAPTSAASFVLLSAKKLAPVALKALQENAGIINVPFDLNLAKLNKDEKNRKVTNVMVALAIPQKPATLNAKLSTTQPSLNVNFVMTQAIAVSNAAPFNGGQPAPPPSPLNAFVNAPVNQTFTLTIDKAAYPNVDFSQVKDVVLGLEYSADLT